MAVMKYLGSDGLYHVLPAYVSSQVQSVNGKTGIVELNYNDIHNLPEELDKKITAPTTGEAGQLLSRKADGTVEWKTVSTEEPTYIAKAFDKTRTYGVGEYIFYDNDLYKAKGFVPAHDFTPSEWEKVKVMEELVNQEVSLDAIAPKFNKSETYEAGDFVIQNNKLYKAKVAKAAGTDFVAANWEEHNVVGLFEDNDDAHKTILNDMAADYDPAHAYTAGDFCIYNGQLYKANDDVTGTWNPAKWDATKVTNELGSEPINNLCSEWTTTGIYTAGSMVVHEGKLYICKETAATVGTFKLTEWVETKAVDELYRFVRKLIEFMGFKFDPNWDGTKVDYQFEVL